VKTREIEARALKFRLLKSIGAGLFFVCVVIVTFFSIRYGSQKDLLPTPLRKVGALNEQASSALYSSENHAPFKPAPPRSKKPRVNGMIGLKTPIDPETYRVIVESGETRLELKVAEIQAMPVTSISIDFKCIEGWTEVMQYAGVRFSEFMKKYGVGVRPDGSPYRYVGLETPDRAYYVSLDSESMMNQQTLLAFEMNGQELAPQNGYPVRLIVPSKYGIKSLKRIGRIFFSDLRPPDFWAERGYDWYSGL
jgi:DMSO/TMAO reductase YedYZ molybdopterin-dependent catalytic subunit